MGEQDRKIYISGLLDPARLTCIYNNGTYTTGAVISDASYRTESLGKTKRKSLHINVDGDNNIKAGISFTDQDDINGIFLDLAGIKIFKFAYRLKNRRVDACFGEDQCVGISAERTEPETDS